MEGDNMEDCLQIRYVKLCFVLECLGDYGLPAQKVSMIRGGIGEMLLQGNCIGDRRCESCGFQEECVVQQVYYHRLKIVPDYVKEKESLGYLYECGDTRTEFREGDILKFNMILFGNVIVHFPAILQAVYRLGLSGLGREKALFQLTEIVNHRGEKVLSRNEVCLGFLQPDMISRYVSERMAQMGKPGRMCFVTPLTQKFEGVFLKEFQEKALIYSIYRRIYLLNCMEGREMERICPFQEGLGIVDQRARQVKVPRHSSTQGQTIYLEGIKGSLEIEPTEAILPWLFAGELVHIGKNTSMGFGQYVVERETKGKGTGTSGWMISVKR